MDRCYRGNLYLCPNQLLSCGQFFIGDIVGQPEFKVRSSLLIWSKRVSGLLSLFIAFVFVALMCSEAQLKLGLS